MQFGDYTYSFQLVGSNSLPPIGYTKVNSQEVGYGALSRYLISKAEGCPIFGQRLELFCAKTNDLTAPYYTDLDEAYQRELATRLASLDLYYKRNTQPLFDSDNTKPILPWGSTNGGGYRKWHGSLSGQTRTNGRVLSGRLATAE